LSLSIDHILLMLLLLLYSLLLLLLLDLSSLMRRHWYAYTIHHLTRLLLL